MFLEFSESDEGVRKASQSYRGAVIDYSIEPAKVGEGFVLAVAVGKDKIVHESFDVESEALDAAEKTAGDIAFGEMDEKLGRVVELTALHIPED